MEIKQPGAHIDHLLRQTRMHNMQLSGMADLKANLLITICSLIVGVSLGQLSADDHGVYSNVLVVLILSSVATISLAVYATMPNVGARAFKRDLDIQSPRFTLLFFGDYSNLTYEEYESEMERVMNEPSLVYQAQLRELYNVGRYLADHKYRKLRLAYLAFLIGMIGATISGIVAYLS